MVGLYYRLIFMMANKVKKAIRETKVNKAYRAYKEYKANKAPRVIQALRDRKAIQVKLGQKAIQALTKYLPQPLPTSPAYSRATAQPYRRHRQERTMPTPHRA